MAVTRADVARLAQVSPALVSYVLNNGPRPVSADARERIENAIRELGYRPNPIAQALRGAGSRTIGMLLPSAFNRYFGELASAVEASVFDAGLTLTVGFSDDDPARESRYIDAFFEHHVDGVIVISSQLEKILDRFAGAKMPIVALDRVPSESSVTSVSVDNRAGVTAAVTHLIEHGHTRIACIGGRIGTEPADERVREWESLVARVTANTDGLLARADFTEDGGYSAMQELLSSSGTDRPTAIFVSSDIQATGALRACADLGVAVPESLALVSFDGTPAAAFTVPALTSYRQPIELLASTAVEQLLAQIAVPGTAPTHVVLPGDLIVRRSCGCTI